MSPLQLLLTGTVLCAVSFALLWAVCVKIRNYGFVDAAWSYGLALLVPIYALQASGYGPRRVIFAMVGTLWSLRLGTHLLTRLLRRHPVEDPRYQTLRKEWKSPFGFLLFFEIQGATVVLFSLPFLLACFNTSPRLYLLEILGLGIALLGVAGEALSDRQMEAFLSDIRNRGKVCSVGLWHYSRHPNYFFESVVWWGLFLALLATPWGWSMIVCPLLMLWFLLRVTGIPLAEQHSLQSKGDAYRAYQRSTSAFFPWFPKNDLHANSL